MDTPTPSPLASPRVLMLKAHTINDQAVMYSYDDQDDCYSVSDKQWQSKPTYLNSFNSRELMPIDLAEIIMHDLLSLEDFIALKDKNLVPPELDLLYQKIQILKQEVVKLKQIMATENPVQKSEEPDASLEQKPEQAEESTPPANSVISAILQLIKAGAVNKSVFDQIKAGATGLSQQELDIIDLIGKHFGLGGSNGKTSKPS